MRWIFWALLLLLVIAYFARDLPRRFVEGQIAGVLGGEVHLGALDWPHDGLYTLRGLEVVSPSLSPALRHLAIERIEARALWQQLLHGQFEHLTLHGLSAEVDLSRPLLSEGETMEAPFRSLELLPGAHIKMVDGQGRQLAEADVEAKHRNEPGYPGRFAARVRGLDLSDLEIVLPLELPPKVREQLAGLELGELEVEGLLAAGSMELNARCGAWQEAFLRLQGEHLEARIRSLDLAALSPAGAPVKASGKVDLEASGTLEAAQLLLQVSPTQFDFEGQKAELAGTTLAANYRKTKAGGELEIDQLEAELLASNLLPESAQPLLPIKLNWQGQVELGPRQARGQGAISSPALGRFPFEGLLAAQSGLDLRLETPRLQLAQLLPFLPPSSTPAGTEGFELADLGPFDFSARAQIQGTANSPRAQVELRFGGSPLPEVRELEGSALLRWSAETELAFEIAKFEAKARAHLPVQGLAPFAVDGHFSGTADLGRRSLELRGLELRTEELGRLTGELSAQLPEDLALLGARAEAKFELRELDVQRYLSLFGPAEMTAGMAFSGQLEASPTILKKAGAPWQLSGSWQLEKAGFASSEGDRVLEGLALAGTLAGQLDGDAAQDAAYTFEAKAQSSGFQILWGTLFGDFSTARVALEANAQGRLDQKPTVGLKLEPSEGLELSAKVDPARHYELNVVARDLEKIRQTWLVPLFAGVAPLRLAGSFDLMAEGQLPEKEGALFSARGKLELHQGQVVKDTLVAEGLELVFPFDLRRQDGVYSGPRLSGRLDARRLAVRNLELPPLRSKLWVEADAIGLEQGLEIALLGGKIHLDRVSANDLFAASPRFETALGFEAISLTELSAGAGFLPLEGKLDGSLPKVVIQGEKLEVEGGGKIALFGGEIEVGDISGRDVLSAYPRLRFSARFHDLDLGQITRRFDFGEMQGIVEGEIEDCEIFRNVPLAFKARLVSVERKGVKQSIDVKAVQNLTILGTGASTNIFDRGIQRFFKRYNYSALGISAELKNDVLLLRGLEKRKDQELFLLGKRPFSIDIVNAQPGKTVSFLAMVRRLKNLDVGAAKTKP